MAVSVPFVESSSDCVADSVSFVESSSDCVAESTSFVESSSDCVAVSVRLASASDCSVFPSAARLLKKRTARTMTTTASAMLTAPQTFRFLREIKGVLMKMTSY